MYAHYTQNHQGNADSQMSSPKIFLVGTHRSPPDVCQGRELTEEELKKINETLKKEFLRNKDDDRFLRSIVHECDEEGKPVRCFFPVENSMTEPEKGAARDEHSAAVNYSSWQH